MPTPLAGSLRGIPPPPQPRRKLLPCPWESAALQSRSSRTSRLASPPLQIIVQIDDGSEKAQKLGFTLMRRLDARCEIARPEQVGRRDGCHAHGAIFVRARRP